MSRRTLALFLAAVAVFAAAAPPAAAAPKMTTQTVRYVGYKKGQAWSRPVLVLVVAAPNAKRTADMVVPNQDPMGRKLDPPPGVVELVKKLTPGDILEVRFSRFKGHNVVNMIRPIKLKANEPPYFTLVKVDRKTIRAQEHLCVIVSKGSQQAQVLVPNVKDKDGKWTPDPRIARQVKRVSKGSQVDVEVRKAGGRVYLQAIHPYARPLLAEFVKVETRQVDDRKYACVVVKVDGKEGMAMLENLGKDPKDDPSPDRKLYALVKTFRPGRKVEMKTYLVEGKGFLWKIAPAKPQPKKKP